MPEPGFREASIKRPLGNKLVYPLNNQKEYLGRITFEVIEEKRYDVLGELQSLSDGTALKKIKDLGAAWGEEIKDKASDAAAFVGDKFTKFRGNDIPGNDGGGPGGARGSSKSQLEAEQAKFKKEQADRDTAQKSLYGNLQPTLGFNRKTINLTGDKIALYLPSAIQIQDTVSYENMELGLIGGAVLEGASAGTGAAAGALAAVAGEVGAAFNVLSGKGEGLSRDAAGLLAGKGAAKFLGNTGAPGAVRSATGVTTNPNIRALFKQVPLRTFSFTFALIPTSQAEAIEIEKIIKKFRTELYPENLEAGGIHVGYRFPNRFLIKVKYKNTEIPGIKFLPVYLQSFNATYNSNGMGMHADGRFQGANISLTFTESRAMAKGDVREGY
jgi:hypothetical protein|tara:strand:+ start:2984 stop:4138 length:1155 start_codon:yes stop_codon:yes gene_type:complete